MGSILLASTASAQFGGRIDGVRNYSGVSDGERMGNDIATLGDLDGDGVEETLIASPYYSAPHATYCGVVRVYSGSSNALLYEVRGRHAFATLGIAVSEAGDVNFDGVPDFAASLYGADRAGEVDLYSGVDGSHLRTYTMGQANDSYGWSLDCADFDFNGVMDLLIGAPGANDDKGAIQIRSGVTAGVMRQVDGRIREGGMGYVARFAGDFNQDGLQDILVGTPYATSIDHLHCGEVSLISGTGNEILWQDFGFGDFEYMGSSLDSIGDLDRDGLPEFLVGTPGARTRHGIVVGEATVHRGADGSILHQYHGKPENEGEGLGGIVRGVGDITGDAIPDYLIASLSHSAFPGMVRAYSGATGQLVGKIHGPANGSMFGRALSSAGDTNGDGRNEFMISSPSFEAVPSWSNGRVSLYNLNPYLLASHTAVSASAATQIDFEFDFPMEAAGDTYKLLISTRPGWILFDYPFDNVPLFEDALVRETYHGHYPFQQHVGLHGVLDAAGDAQGSIALAANEIPAVMVGHTLYLAAASSDTGLQPAFHSSVARTLVIEP